jgi:dihydrofolate reductase
MRNLVYFVACTVDRYIAREDGSFDFFLAEGDHVADLLSAFPETMPGHLREVLGVTADNQLFDAVVMGRRTYEVGVAIGVTSPYPHLSQYVVSRSMESSLDPQVELVSGDPVARVRELKQEPGKDIWLCGGGELATALFPEIDELILKVHPILLGSGIPLFTGTTGQASLELADSRVYDNGFILLRFGVRH